MKTISVFTTTRAEFGLYRPLLNQISSNPCTDYELFVGGTHLSESHGNTIWEIKETELKITDTFDFLEEASDTKSLLKSVGCEVNLLADIFEKYDFEAICLLGDRFEFLPIVSAALLFNKYIIHIQGGETTTGAVDEQFRHMITKGSHLHFAACEEYAENIRRMGESSDRVFNTGALGIDNIVNRERIPQEELFDDLDLEPDKPTVTMTYHPVTIEFDLPPEEQIENLFDALSFYDFQLLVTGPNLDPGNEALRTKIKDHVSQNKRYSYRESLGVSRYHNMIDYSEFVLGNSSSGIIEVPYFKKPTVNIGTRQKGRVRHSSVIDVDYTVDSIRAGIEKALSSDFKDSLHDMVCKFGEGNAADNMVDIINSTTFDRSLLKKTLSFEDANHE